MSTATFLEAVFTVLVVGFALFLVGEHLVGALNLLELLLVTTFIGVMSLGQLEVGLLNGAVVCVFVNA